MGGNMLSFVGKVVSNRMTKSVLVAVSRFKEYPKYKTKIRRTRKFMIQVGHRIVLPPSQAHDETNECNIGDIVRIGHSRPLSKRKCWVVTDILQREKVYDPEAAAAAAAERDKQRELTPLTGNKLERGFAASQT